MISKVILFILHTPSVLSKLSYILLFMVSGYYTKCKLMSNEINVKTKDGVSINTFSLF